MLLAFVVTVVCACGESATRVAFPTPPDTWLVRGFGTELLDVVHDPAGATYVLSRRMGDSRDFGGHPFSEDGDQGDQTYALSKLGPTGQEEWKREWKTWGALAEASLAAVPQGGVVIEAYAWNEVDLGLGTPRQGTLLWRMSPDGETLWQTGHPPDPLEWLKGWYEHVTVTDRFVLARAFWGGSGNPEHKEGLDLYDLDGRLIWSRHLHFDDQMTGDPQFEATYLEPDGTVRVGGFALPGAEIDGVALWSFPGYYTPFFLTFDRAGKLATSAIATTGAGYTVASVNMVDRDRSGDLVLVGWADEPGEISFSGEPLVLEEAPPDNPQRTYQYWMARSSDGGVPGPMQPIGEQNAGFREQFGFGAGRLLAVGPLDSWEDDQRVLRGPFLFEVTDDLSWNVAWSPQATPETAATFQWAPIDCSRIVVAGRFKGTVAIGEHELSTAADEGYGVFVGTLDLGTHTSSFAPCR